MNAWKKEKIVCVKKCAKFETASKKSRKELPLFKDAHCLNFTAVRLLVFASFYFYLFHNY